jgi:hypothetical protein
MGMKLAQIVNNEVVNIIEVGEVAPDWAQGWPDAADAVIGWTYDGETFSPPLPPSDTDLRVAWREGKSLPKNDLVMACVSAEIITLAEAVAVGRGDWPAAVVGFLELLTPEQQVEVQLEWANNQNIRRNNYFVLILGSWMELSPEQLDALFGYV